MAITYKVKQGETIGQIAQKFGITPQDIKGFQSGNPDLIFPGEELTLGNTGQATTPAQGQFMTPLSPQAPQQLVAPQGQLMTPYGGQPFQVPQAPQQLVAQQPVAQQPVAQQPVATPQDELPPSQQMAQTFTTPSGAVVNEQGEVIEQSPTLKKFGIGDLTTNFSENPFETLSGITQQVISSLGLPDVRDNLTKIAQEMEDLANERDDELQKIEDNPWISGPSKSQLAQKVIDKYEKKLSNRQGKLTLLQNAYTQARQEAQFAINTAISLYDKQRQLNYQMTQDALDREERTTEAQRKLGEIDFSIQEIGGRKVRFGFDREGNVVSEVDLGVSGGGTLTDQLYAGLSSPTATAVRSLVSKFSSEPTMQNFATVQEGYNFASAISDKTTNPADDQALIYSLAKALDPNSVVREGEYATAQKYAQSWVKAYGKGVTQAILGTGFLSEEARKNIKKTIEQKYEASQKSYSNLYDNYTKNINNLTGRKDSEKFLIDYQTPTIEVSDMTEQPQANREEQELLNMNYTPEQIEYIKSLPSIPQTKLQPNNQDVNTYQPLSLNSLFK